MNIVLLEEKTRIKEVVEIHMISFKGFFLTFLGRGFLCQLYTGFIEHPNSGLIIAKDEDDSILGFLAYSEDLSGFYKFLISKKLISFAWYAGLAFVRNPKIMMRLLRAFTYSGEAKRKETYIELSSIGVLPETEGKGVGSAMISMLKQIATETNDEKEIKYEYIKLETDATDNEGANIFYKKNGFVLDHDYLTHEDRKMNEYRWYL